VQNIHSNIAIYASVHILRPVLLFSEVICRLEQQNAAARLVFIQIVYKFKFNLFTISVFHGVEASILACHASDPGSIPGGRAYLFTGTPNLLSFILRCSILPSPSRTSMFFHEYITIYIDKRACCSELTRRIWLQIWTSSSCSPRCLRVTPLPQPLLPLFRSTLVAFPSWISLR
jgi:hypothetical protein